MAIFQKIFVGFGVLAVASGCGNVQTKNPKDLVDGFTGGGTKGTPIQFPSSQPFYVLDKESKTPALVSLGADFRQKFSIAPSVQLSSFFVNSQKNEKWNWKTIEYSPNGIWSASLQFNNRPVWGSNLKAVLGVSQKNSLQSESSRKQEYLQGNAPSHFFGSSVGEAEKTVPFSSFSMGIQKAAEQAAWNLNFHPWRIQNGTEIYFPTQKSLRAAYLFIVNASPELPGRGPGLPLEIIVDAETGEVFTEKVLALHATGIARLYEENVRASAEEGVKEIPLTNLSANGAELSNAQFRVLNCAQNRPSANCAQLTVPQGAGNYTNFTYEDEDLDELVAYHSLSKASAWYKKVIQASPADGATWGEGIPGERINFGFAGDYKATVYVRTLTYDARSGSNTPDNASYLPSGTYGEGKPHLIIGTGWEAGQPGEERELRYLGKDADVSMHEFGHHIVWRGLRETFGQSGAMHEGYADFFTYAITGNNKLGEGIVKSKTSLRNGEQVGVVASYLNTSKPPHIAGQFWSSCLWQLRKNMGEWKDGMYKLDKIAWLSIDLMKQNADFYNALEALNQATEMFAAANGDDVNKLKEQLHNVMFERGFLANGWDGNPKLPAPSLDLKNTMPAGDGVLGTSSSEKKKSSPKKWYECGVVGKSNSKENQKAGLAIVLLPLLGLLTFRKQKIPKRVKVKVEREKKSLK